MIVVDLGCFMHEISDSVTALVEQYQPTTLFGFDPLATIGGQFFLGETLCVISPKAAWTYNGRLGIQHLGTGTKVLEGGDDVDCFDISEFVETLEDPEIVLKMDVEGCEYGIIQRLMDTGADRKITLGLVEWHSDERLVPSFPIEDWWM